MKKKLEAELISIAHRILKLKNKSELDQLYLETQKLYEKLAVLKFVEENFADIKPTIGRNAAEEILETAFEEDRGEAGQSEAKATTEDVKSELRAEAENAAEEVKAEIPSETETAVAADKPQPDEEEDEEQEEEKIQEPSTPEEEKLAPDATPTEKEADEVIAEAEDEANADSPETEVTEGAPVAEAGIDFEQPEAQEEVAAAVPEEAKQEDLFKPSFEWAFDAKEEAKPEAAETPKQTSQVAFEDLLGAGYKDPVFVKPEDETRETDVPAENNWIDPLSTPAPADTKSDVIPISRRDDKVPVFKMNTEGAINDRMSKGITVGLNDRIAFVKNLFNNSNEDYNRVLSQLLTFDTYAEAQDFIDNMVKPDYNNWEGKEDFEQRFMEVIEKKFS